mmetsp:Transcript_8997/g.38110  ORF Transcript_8997/g.38110 Transcript_8997/m.38110 type:complete len:233 (+) Transcript_8997:360-1058(+)
MFAFNALKTRKRARIPLRAPAPTPRRENPPSRFFPRRIAHRSHGEVHDGGDDVAVVGLERVHSLAAGHAGLGHDELDVLRLHAGLVDLALVLLLDLRLGRLHGGHLRAELLRGSLRGGGEVLDLRLAENHVRVRVGVLVHVGLRDHKEDVLALLDRDARDVGNGLQAELQNRLAALLLAAGLLGATLFLLAVRIFLLTLVVVVDLLDGGLVLRSGGHLVGLSCVPPCGRAQT